VCRQEVTHRDTAALGRQRLVVSSPYYNLPSLIKALNAAQDQYKIQSSSLDEFADLAKAAQDRKTLPLLKGEMRYLGIEVGYNGMLGATHSSRIPLKILNDQAQTALINVAEPISTLNAMLGGAYQEKLLERAWLDLLKNHAHDSICGAAIDAAHLENPTRFRTVVSIANECSRNASEELWAKIDTQSAFKEGDLTLTFFNTLPFARKGVQQVVIDVPQISFGISLLSSAQVQARSSRGLTRIKLLHTIISTSWMKREIKFLISCLNVKRRRSRSSGGWIRMPQRMILCATES
jgi:hypothetical protein